MSSTASTTTQDKKRPIPPRPRNQLVRLAFVIPLIIGVGLVIGPLIYTLSLTSRRHHHEHYNTTTAPVNTSTLTTSTVTPTTTAPNTTAPETTSTSTLGTTSTVTTTTTTTPMTTTRTTTHRTTTSTTTSGQFATCQACSLNAQLGSCASEYAACLANTYNCPVLCYGTFQLNGNPPATCTNGAIPQWPPLRECICQTANYTCGNVCTACDYTTGTSTPETTTAPPICQSCFDTAVAGPCSAQAAVCAANPVGTCALVCAPYYRANLLVFPGCLNETVAPGWLPLAACLCPFCGNNVTCTTNEC